MSAGSTTAAAVERPEKSQLFEDRQLGKPGPPFGARIPPIGGLHGGTVRP